MSWTVEAIDRLANWDVVENVEDAAFRHFSWLIPALRLSTDEYADAIEEACTKMGDGIVVVAGWGVS